MREQKYHVYLTAEEQSRVIQSLIRLKNELLEQGKYTDAVDDVLCKVLSAKKKRGNDRSPDNPIFYKTETLKKYAIHSEYLFLSATCNMMQSLSTPYPFPVALRDAH